MIDVEKIARVLYDCEKARAESARSILTGGKPTGCEGILMEPYEECAEAFRFDARAVVAAMRAREKAEPTSAVAVVERLREALERISQASPVNTNCDSARSMAGWCRAVADCALSDADEIIRALKEAGHG